MQRLRVSKWSERQYAKLERMPSRWAPDWWNDTDDTETTPNTKISIAAVEGGDTVELVEMAASEPPGNETVLVVDDEPLVCEMIADILRSLGYRVIGSLWSFGSPAPVWRGRENQSTTHGFFHAGSQWAGIGSMVSRQISRGEGLITTGSSWELANQIGTQERVAVLPKPFDVAQLVRMVRLILGGSRL